MKFTNPEMAGEALEKSNMGGACSVYGGGEKCLQVGKPEGKRLLGRPIPGWEDNIKAVLEEVVCGVMDWIELAQDRDKWWTFVKVVMNFRVP
jgi:hypothetical protein